MAKVVVHDDELDEEVVVIKKGKQVSSDDDEDEAPKTKGTRKSQVVDEDEEEAPKSSSKKSSKVVEDEDEEEVYDEVDFGDEEMMKNTGFLEKLQVKDKKQVARFSLLDVRKAIRGFAHYVEGKGSFSCFTDHKNPKAPKAACCKTLGDPQMRVVALVVHYTNADTKTGKLMKDVPVEFEIKYVNLTKKQFQDISKLAEEDGTVYGMDITMAVRSNGIGLDFHRIASKAKYLSNSDLTDEILEAANEVKDKLGKTLPKKITKAELAVYLAAAQNEEEDPDMEEIEDI